MQASLGGGLGGSERGRLDGRRDRLAACLVGVGDHRDGAALVQGLEREGAYGRGHARDLRDVTDRHGREGEERAGHEEVVGELGPGLTELGEVGDHRGVVVEQGRGLRAGGASGARDAAREEAPAASREATPTPAPATGAAGKVPPHRRGRTGPSSWWWSERWSARRCVSR